jgi:adenine-specific DNA-methyltransferase
MADMFEPISVQQFNILDPGAGEGILGIALVKKLSAGSKNVRATFVEIDKQVFDVLSLRVKENAANADANIVNDSFISYGVRLRNSGVRFSHIIINPPYFKIRTDSSQAKFLRFNGIHTTNIYSAFVWLSAQLLNNNGQLTAIIPRSFCNGPYFAKFRHYFLNNFSLDSIHIFNSRDSVFSGDSVLQENIIIKISKREQEANVKVSYSADQNFKDVEQKVCPIEDVILSNDPDMVIHIPHIDERRKLNECVSNTLTDLELQVSTGPVVDFRLEDRISPVAQDDAVPLLYPAHVSSGEMIWPLQDIKKRGQYYIPATGGTVGIKSPKAATDNNVLPSDGYYVVVRRFSSKEEKRRIFA